MADPFRQQVLAAFGVAVRRLRSEHGWSQEELADRVGIHRTYMGDVERGARNIGLVKIARIADALDLPISGLMAEVERSV